jgi:hypothetical protein
MLIAVTNLVIVRAMKYTFDKFVVIAIWLPTSD